MALGTILRCDLDGTIREISVDGLGIAGKFAVGRPFDQIVADADAATARDFISAVPGRGAVFDRMLAVDLREGRTVLRFNGMAVDGGVLVAIRRVDAAVALSRSVLPPAPSPRFSACEREVIPLLLDGLSNRLIAGRLTIEESAVKARLRTIYRKLGVTSRARAVMTLITNGMAECG